MRSASGSTVVSKECTSGIAGSTAGEGSASYASAAASSSHSSSALHASSSDMVTSVSRVGSSRDLPWYGEVVRAPVVIAIVAGGIVVLRVAMRVAGYGTLAGNTIVRCRQGHLFTTVWVPLASFKAVRLGPWRYQFCPVGRHWSLVRPVREGDLTPEERQQAAATKDIRIP